MAEKPVREVREFLDECSVMVGKQARDSFHQGVWDEYSDLNIESPIEQYFYTAILSMAELGGLPRHDAPLINGEPTAFGLQIQPQFAIENYRVDFYVAWHGYYPDANPKSRMVLVECDSQEWHERTEKERRYEKQRDRDFVRLGYQVFRFTGKEIREEPFRVALEVLCYLAGKDYAELVGYMDEIKEACAD